MPDGPALCYFVQKALRQLPQKGGGEEAIYSARCNGMSRTGFSLSIWFRRATFKADRLKPVLLEAFAMAERFPFG